jgi:hypothetical protein
VSVIGLLAVDASHKNKELNWIIVVLIPDDEGSVLLLIMAHSQNATWYSNAEDNYISIHI